jgi:V/A-type H+-transporting ATPase subunit I
LFYPEKMKEISIIVHDDYVENLVRDLHETGLIELVDLGKSGRDFVDLLTQSRSHEAASKCADIEMQLNKIYEVLSRAKDYGAVGKGGVLSDFFSPEIPSKYTVKPREMTTCQDEAETLSFDLMPKITNCERKLEEISEELGQLEEHKKQISYLSAFRFDLEYLGESQYLIIKAGTTQDEAKLRKAVSKVSDALIFTSQVDKQVTCVTLVAHIEDKQALENAVRGAFSSFSLPHYTGKPQAALEQIENRTKELLESKKALWVELKGLSKDHLKDLIIVREEIGIFKTRAEALSRFGKTESTSVLTGWAPHRHLRKLEGIIKSSTNSLAFIHTSDPEEEENIPIYTRNPRWAKPFEMLTEMFALPQYSEIDPTIILAPIFVIFFGLMLGDAAYGALVLLAGLLIYKGQAKVSKSMHDMGIILSCIGLSGVIFGIIQGSYLGPLTVDNPLTPLLYSGSLEGNVYHGLGANNVILLDSMNNPIPLLILALIIGLFHLNLGLVMAVAQNARRKAYDDILYSQVSWFLLQFSGFVVFGGFFGWFLFPMYIEILAYILGIAGIILVLMQKGEANPEGKQTRKGPLGLFDITGFIGNWLSYARILALGLATAGIAMTVNIIATLLKDVFSAIPASVCAGLMLIALGLLAVGYLKKNTGMMGFSIFLILVGLFGAIGQIAISIALILLIVFIAGHVLNAVLQALGGFIHALRLHYVEFFGQFYAGGGKTFSPFLAQREHTVLEEADKLSQEAPT